jgi:hypothetical protein
MYSNTNQAERELYREALKRLPFHEYLANNYHLHRNNPSNPTYPNDQNPDKFTFDYFKIDNLYEEERVNSYYKNPSYLWRAYQKVGLVKVNNVELASFEFSSNYCYATIAGQPKLNLRGGKRYSKENIKQLVAQLCELYDLSGEYEIYDNAVLEITKHHPLIRSAFDKLGERRIAELEFSITKIKQALIDYDVKTGKNHNAIIDSVYTMFILNVKSPLKKIKKDLQKIYDHYKIPAIAKASGLALWFEIKECKIVTSTTNKITLTKVREEQRAYILLRYKFNLHRQLHIT